MAARSGHARTFVDLCDLREVKLVGGNEVTSQLDLAGVVDRREVEQHHKGEQQHGVGDDEQVECNDQVARRRPRRVRRSCDRAGSRGDPAPS